MRRLRLGVLLTIAFTALSPGLAVAKSTSTSGSGAAGDTLTASVSGGSSSHSGGGAGSSRPDTTTCTAWSQLPELLDSFESFLAVMVIDDITYRAYTRSCTDPYGFTQTENTWVPDQQTPQQLASVAYDKVVRQLPRPAPGFAPPAGKAVVQVGTWFWTDPGTWRPVSATASIPGLSATVTAVPVSLTFDPGDGRLGSGPVTCAGPGPMWTPADGDDTTSPCQYTYRHSSAMSASGSWPTSLTITWDVGFTASDGTSAHLAQLTTTTTTNLVVRELQAVVVTG